MAAPAGLNGKQIIARALRRIFVGLILTAAVVYSLDYVVLRFRIARNESPFATVTVRPYYAVPRKDHKVEFMFGDPQDQTCVNSLFPHLGDNPCWYLSRNTNQRVDM